MFMMRRFRFSETQNSEDVLVGDWLGADADWDCLRFEWTCLSTGLLAWNGLNDIDGRDNRRIQVGEWIKGV